jgi:hypothetical protein
VIEDLERHPNSAISEIHARIGEEISRNTLRYTITKLVQTGQVVAVGEKRWRTYCLNQEGG